MLTSATDAGIEVYFQPVLPVSPKYPDYGRINTTAHYINETISKFCVAVDCEIIDITHLFVKNEEGYFVMPRDYTSDGLHPNSKLYKEWLQKIVTTID